MTWVVWRQQRLQILVSLGFIAIAAGVMLSYRFRAISYMTNNGISGCVDIDENRCSSATMLAFNDQFQGFARTAPLVLLVLPVVLGMFTGGPLFAREFEQGTYLLSLTQSVGRIRWWATKLLVGGLPIAIGMVMFGLIAAWSFGPLSFVTNGRMTTPGFETQGLTPGAYFILAFCAGSTAGLLLRNVLAGMATTLVVYTVCLIAISNFARPHYLSPERVTGNVESSVGESPPSGLLFVPANAWPTGTRSYDAQGQEVIFQPGACEETETIEDCLTRQGVISQTVSFHPNSQFWPMQAIEGTVTLIVSAGVLALGLWRVRRRIL